MKTLPDNESVFYYAKNYMIQELEIDNQTNEFSTFDLGCSAALISAGFEIISLDKKNPRKVQFIFHRATGIEKVVEDYWVGKLAVSARVFFDNVKMLKNRIYSE